MLDLEKQIAHWRAGARGEWERDDSRIILEIARREGQPVVLET